MAHPSFWPSLLSAALLLSLSLKARAADLNQALDQQENQDIESVLTCMKNGEKVNYMDGYMLAEGVVYKGIDCGGLYGGYSGFERISVLDQITTMPCNLGGNIQEQWTLRPDQGATKLTLIQKHNACDIGDGPPQHSAEAILRLPPVRWSCVPHSGYDPMNIGLDCSSKDE